MKIERFARYFFYLNLIYFDIKYFVNYSIFLLYYPHNFLSKTSQGIYLYKTIRNQKWFRIKNKVDLYFICDQSVKNQN